MAANEVERSAGRTAWITNPAGESRLLLAFPGLAELEGQWVTNATLSIPLGRAVATDVEVAVDALTRSWDAGATWTSPWTDAGGDLEGRLGTSVRLAAGRAGILTADVTDVVRAMVEGEIEEHGLMLRPGSGSRSGFTAREAALLDDGAGRATLRVYYRDLKALGYEGGPRALMERRRESAVMDEDARR